MSTVHQKALDELMEAWKMNQSVDSSSHYLTKILAPVKLQDALKRVNELFGNNTDND